MPAALDKVIGSSDARSGFISPFGEDNLPFPKKKNAVHAAALIKQPTVSDSEAANSLSAPHANIITHEIILATCSITSTIATTKNFCFPHRLPRKALYTAEKISAGESRTSENAASAPIIVRRTG